MSFTQFIQELNGKRPEGELLTTIFISLLSSVLVLILGYFLFLKNVPEVFNHYGYPLFLGILTIAFITPAIRQVRAYKEFLCMSGMMIGMATGMISGFLLGMILGATNGMFIGGTIGMLIGIFMGVWMGSCCGIMGIMEGTMAGFMGGLMGAMTSVMTVNDHLYALMGISFVIGNSILFMLNYMIYIEMKENKRQQQENHKITIILSIVLTILLMMIMVYGPRSLLFG